MLVFCGVLRAPHAPLASPSQVLFIELCLPVLVLVFVDQIGVLPVALRLLLEQGATAPLALGRCAFRSLERCSGRQRAQAAAPLASRSCKLWQAHERVLILNEPSLAECHAGSPMC